MASGLQLNVFKMFSFLKKFLFFFHSLLETEQEGDTFNGFAPGLEWQQSGQRVVGL